MNPSVEPSRKGHRTRTRSQKVARKQRALPQDISIDFSIPPAFRNKHTRTWIARTVTRAMLSHLLYTRGIVPSPVSDILRLDDELSGCKSSQVRSIRKCARQISDLMQQVDNIIIDSNYGHLIDAVLLTLGPAWSRQRERHILHLGNLGEDSKSTLSPSVQNEHTLSRKFIANLMDFSNESLNNSTDNFLYKSAMCASSYQAQVSVWVPMETAKEMYNHKRVTDSNKNVVVRHDFTTQEKTKNRSQTKSLMINASVAGVNQPEWDESLGVWMTLKTAVKGFRSMPNR